MDRYHIAQNLLPSIRRVDRSERVSQQHQLEQRLLALLRDKRASPGDFFPSIRQISRHFKVGQVTAQLVVNELAGKGLLVKQHGKRCVVGSVSPHACLAPSRKISLSLSRLESGEDYSAPIANMLAGVAVGISSHGWSLSIVDGQADGGEFKEICHEYCNGLTDGVIILGGIGGMDDNLRLADQIGLPIVIGNRYAKDFCSVAIDTETICGRVAAKLWDEGKRRFAVRTIPSVNPRFTGIIEGVKGELVRRGAPWSDVLVDYFRFRQIPYDSVVDSIRSLLDREDYPEVIFCSPEFITFAAFAAVRAASKEVRIVSVDNARELPLDTLPGVIRIRPPYFELGRTAGELLVSSIKEGVRPVSRYVKLPARMVEESHAGPENGTAVRKNRQ